ncbi:MAG TPA: hypothetical protein VJA21_04830 [Verrucomicrobiae bacterium]
MSVTHGKAAFVSRLRAICTIIATVAATARGGSFTADFNSGQPVGTTLYGSAFVDTVDGVGGSGVLKLTTAVNSQEGSFIISDLDGGNPVTSFSASFKMLIGGGNVADGLSFNFAGDLPNAAFGEEGAGTGLTVEIDTYDNGGGEAPAIDVKAGGIEIATSTVNLDVFRTGGFVDVSINWQPDGTLDVTVNGTAVYSGLIVPLLPFAGRFGLGARTGGLNDNHWVDDLTITTGTQLPAHPVVRFVSPTGNVVRGDAKIAFTLLDGSPAKLKGGSAKLTLNGNAVTPTVASSGGIITVAYQPPRLLPAGGSVTAVLTYADTTGQTYSFTDTFQVAPYVGPTGNIYEVVLLPAGISWPDAKAAAEQRTYAGHHGHLATIGGFDEDLYLENLRELSPPVLNSQLWVGGYQIRDQATPNDGWFWVNNEGPISGFNGGSTYSNWRPGEPNDCCNTLYVEDNEENYLAIGLFSQFGWNDEGNVANNDHGNLYGYVVEYETQLVAIDIKPGGTPNVINLGANGKIPVAILSSASFNAATVDPKTITFGHSGTEAAPVNYSLSDVNGDGLKDLICQFNTQDTGFLCGDAVGLLRGQTKVGWPIHGSDSIQTLPCPPFTLSLQAMQDAHKLTDVYLTFNVVANNCTPPVASPHVLLQSLDLLGHVRWSANSLNLPLVSGLNNSSTGDLLNSNLLRHQKFQAQVQVVSCQNNNALVLSQQGVVLLRPDVAVSGVNAPQSAYAGLVVNIGALIGELNGDLGATGTVYLMEGATVLDQATGFIGPNGTASVVFSTVFSTLGTHQLKVVVANETPADYDYANNTQDLSIEVTQTPASYYAYYNHYVTEFSEDYNWPWWQSGTNYYNVNDENLNESLYIPGTLSFPLDDVAISTFSDGNPIESFDLPNLAADFSYPPPYYYAQVYRNLAAGFDFYLQTYQDPWSQGSYAQIYRSAANDVFYSVYHNYYWGDGSYSYANQYGTYLNAATSVGIRLVIKSGGSAYGGSVNMPVYGYSWDSPFDYEDPITGAYDRGYSRGTSTFGSDSGYVTP